MTIPCRCQRYSCIATLFVLLSICSCADQDSSSAKVSTAEAKAGGYSGDLQLLMAHGRQLIELTSADGMSRVALSAADQGRVMTSTATGEEGLSFGWLNAALIESDQRRKQFNPVGGEERFWIGPEGGQYGFYFHSPDSFQMQHWRVPAVIDTLPFDVTDSSGASAAFSKSFSITNYIGQRFDMRVDRTISLLGKEDAADLLGTNKPTELAMVGYASANTLSNIGPTGWTRETGLPSIWLLGMFTPSPKTTVIIPFVPKKDAKKFITSNYFGTIPENRLHITDSVLYFTCDGLYRSKIGLAPEIAKPLAAAFDFEHNVLTLLIPEIYPGQPYVNSKWEQQAQPYKGDVINSYNDGPLEDGTQMGPFFEIESSSPALALAPGASSTYTQRTFHFSGDYGLLKQLAKDILHIDLDSIKN